MGKLLKDTSEELSKRMSKLDFNSSDYGPGRTATLMGITISQLQQMGEQIENLNELNDTDNYHWEIIGMLINIITTQFEYIERKSIF